LNEASIARGNNERFTSRLQECYGPGEPSEPELVEFTAIQVDPEEAVP